VFALTCHLAGSPQTTSLRGRGLDARHAARRNRRDYDNIPAGAREKLEFVWLGRVDDAIAAALEGE
jgi:hypothetical protein